MTDPRPTDRTPTSPTPTDATPADATPSGRTPGTAAPRPKTCGSPSPSPVLLHLDAGAGPPGESVSRRLTALFAGLWRGRYDAAGQPCRYVYRDLAAAPVPPIRPAYVALGRRVERHGGVPPHKVSALAGTPDEEREWSLTVPLIDELCSAHTVLLGVPMYNFSVPAALKAWIDRVTFPAAFTDPDSGRRLLHGTRIVAVLSRGGAYGPGTPRHDCDFQGPYLRAYFRSLGVADGDVHLIPAEMTISDLVPELARFRDLAVQSLRSAEDALRDLATAGAPVAG
jgi:FMN-dependent NADH-azoreductase